MLAALLTFALAASSTPLSDFELPVALQIGGEGVQAGSTVTVGTGQHHGGTHAACIHYRFIAEPKGLQYVGFGADLRMPLRLAKFHAWVLGDGSGNGINVRLVDASGETHQFQLGRAGFVGWRKLSVAISDRGLSWGGDNNGRLEPPLRLGLLLVDSQRRQAEGDIWVDDLAYDLEESADPDWALPLTPPGPARLEGAGLKPGTKLTADVPGRWELAYQFDGGAQPEYAQIRLDAPLPRADALAVWVTGDGRGQILRAQLRDAGGETHQLSFGPILWQGARRCELPVKAAEHWGGDNNGQLDLPLTLAGLVVDRAAAGTGTLAFAGLTAVPSRGAPRALQLSAETCDGDAAGLGGDQVQPASKLVRDPSTKHGGTASWRLDYAFAQVAGLEYLEIPTPCPLGTQPGPLTVWVRGDGSGSPLRLRLTEAGGECHQFDLGKLDFTDWRQLRTDFSGPHGHWLGDDNGKFDGELRLSSILLDSGTRPSAGSVWLDDVEVQTTARPADTVRPSFTDGRSGGIYAPGEPVQLSVAWRSLQALGEQPAELPVTIKLRGPGGQPLRTIEQTVPLDAGAGTQTLPLAGLAEGTGIYEATLIWRVADDFATQQRSFCRLPDVGETDVDTNPFGACLHYAQHKGQVPLNFELLQRGGGRWARDEYSWGVVEQKPGVYTFPAWNESYMRAARAQKIRPFIIFDYTNPLYDKGESPTSDAAQEAFARYSAALVERYRDVCHDWEVYNEPNIGFWHPKPDAVVYTRLLKRTYAAVKQADPTCTVAGICTAGIDFGYIETVLKEGGGPFMDVLSVHPYRYPGSPEATGFVDDLNRLHALMEKYGIGGKPVWITEIGWPNHVTGGGSTEEHSAACLVRMVCLARSLPFVGPVMWYDFQDDAWDPKYNEANFGLVRPDYSPKRPYMAAAVMARALARKHFVRWVLDQPPLYVQEYEGEGGEQTLVLWSTPSETRVTVRLAGGPVHGLAALDGAEGPLPAGPLTVGEAPVFISGRFKTAEVLPELSVGASPETVYPGDRFRLACTLANPAAKAARAELRGSAPAGWRVSPDTAVTLQAGRVGTVMVRVQVPAAAAPGDYEVSLRGGPGEWAVRVPVRVAPPLALRLLPGAEGLKLAARAVDDHPLTAATVGLADGRAVPLGNLKGGQTVVKPAGAQPAVAPGRTRLVRAAVGWGGGGAMTVQLPLTCWPCRPLRSVQVDGRLDEWAGTPPADLDDWQSIAGAAPQDAADLSAAVRVGYTAAAFCLAAEVQDDRAVLASSPPDSWNDDSLQFALDPRHATRFDSQVDEVEVGLNLGHDGPHAWRYFPHGAELPAGSVAIRRQGGSTIYEAAVAWSACGLPAPPPAGTLLGFGALVNENDGAGREGWLQVYSGIGWSKQPLELGSMVVLGA